MEADKKTLSLQKHCKSLLLTGAAVIAFALAGHTAQAEIRVMPLGDSLTSSVNGEASYRYWLWKRIAAKGYDVDFVGSQWGVGNGASGEPGDFDQDHEGHPGATTEDILYGLDYWAGSYRPDVVLLLVGGNDIERGWSTAKAMGNTRRIINALRAANPRVVILWAMIPPASSHNKEAKSYNSALGTYARKWSTSKSPIKVVNLWSGFSASRDTVDGQHPNTAGEKKYASRFYSALAPVLSRMRGR